jgi:hypothetical protein
VLRHLCEGIGTTVTGYMATRHRVPHIGPIGRSQAKHGSGSRQELPAGTCKVPTRMHSPACPRFRLTTTLC